MTIHDIFSKLSNHMIKGMMFHEQMANYYDFLGMRGYKRCHEYHYLDESCMYRRLNRYFINHKNYLINSSEVENPNVIPQSWYKYSRHEVDNATKKSAIKNGLQMWYDWEKETKDIYEDAYIDLVELGEIACAIFVKELIYCVDNELKYVERYMLNKKATNYDMIDIVEEQTSIHDTYRCKTHDVGKLL